MSAVTGFPRFGGGGAMNFSPLQPALLPDDPRLAPHQIIDRALSYNPVARFALFSGGDGSLTTTHWLMNNVDGCEVLHINTGIGCRKTREFVRDTCRDQHWPLTEVRAKEDCGQDYENIVLKHGFPGPAQHSTMYNLLKGRAIELIVRQRKTQWRDKILLATGIRYDDSQRRTGYGGGELTFKGAQMWANPMYWEPMPPMDAWVRSTNIARNPVSAIVGMSCECLCGAYADKGEKAIIRLAEPETADYLDDLERRVRARGHDWGWEGRPPAPRDDRTSDMFMPMCTNCLKASAQ